ncbi:hypothetical protein JAO76_06070 [Pontibacter sp. BT310]|uniref:Uncharacterized protein n=1 Tax=Pontibacter populi TaxID=890055 RepID=A0ABS6X9D7_9BACT|nr:MULTISPECIES: hypothetical protein [Pontibacter]MBJ6117746.1 hypothetical protein [Pontibacter sp. BT310]MBR0570172.1 hypothetical protein [Microvirga sp. STS03]MBW3364598.1 hypothetical protein [Pontibacter populi]
MPAIPSTNYNYPYYESLIAFAGATAVHIPGPGKNTKRQIINVTTQLPRNAGSPLPACH